MTPYETLGGEAGVRALVDRFYDLMDLEPAYAGIRALHGTHISTGDRMWSTLPHLRPMATVVADTLGWYGIDDDGGFAVA